MVKLFVCAAVFSTSLGVNYEYDEEYEAVNSIAISHSDDPFYDPLYEMLYDDYKENSKPKKNRKLIARGGHPRGSCVELNDQEIIYLQHKDWGWGGNLNSTLSFKNHKNLEIGPTSFVEVEVSAKSSS